MKKLLEILWYVFAFGSVIAVVGWQLTHHPTREEFFEMQKKANTSTGRRGVWFISPALEAGVDVGSNPTALNN